uniref:Rubellidin-1.1 n=1 Tax=Litoria rubella TaxID=104895 RepID=RBE11_LITRU
VDFFA